MTVTRMKLSLFTAFEELDFEPSPGVNLLVGANETGKTHLMKAAYAACYVSKSEIGFVEKLVRVFLPQNSAPGRLVKRQAKSSHCEISIHRDKARPRALFPNHAKTAASAAVKRRKWMKNPISSVYVPVKEMLANAPGFLSLYRARETHFEEVYADILERAYMPLLRERAMPNRTELAEILQTAMGGEIEVEGETFFHRSHRGKIEFTLVAEGMRKIGLLWLLVKNGALLPESSAPQGSVLFWDEPEANLNPGLFGPAVEFLLELQRQGAQIFVASHSYGILRGFDLRKRREDKVAFHSLYRHEKDGEIRLRTVDSYLAVEPNAIAEASDDLYDRVIEQSIGGVRR